MLCVFITNLWDIFYLFSLRYPYLIMFRFVFISVYTSRIVYLCCYLLVVRTGNLNWPASPALFIVTLDHFYHIRLNMLCNSIGYQRCCYVRMASYILNNLSLTIWLMTLYTEANINSWISEAMQPNCEENLCNNCNIHFK